MKSKSYRVTLTRGDNTYTAYEGGSRNAAAKHGDQLRTVLVIGKGTGEVSLFENHVLDVCWSVNDGEAFLSCIGGASKRLS